MTIADRIEAVLPPPLAGVVERSRSDSTLLYSSSLAFYALVSLAPIVILTLWIVSLLASDRDVKELATALKEIAPEKLGADRALTRVAQLGTKVGIPAAIVALWPATAYGGGLRRAFEQLSPTPEREFSGLRGRGLAIAALLPLFVIGGLAGSYVSASVVGGSLLGTVAGWIFALVAAFVLVGVATGVIYQIFAPETFALRPLVRGAATCAAGVAVLSLLFTVFLNMGADFQERYASSGLAAVVLLAVWLFLSNTMLLVGYKVALESR